METNVLNSFFSVSWWKNISLGLISLSFSLFMKALIAAIYLVWLLEKIALGVVLFPMVILSFVLWEGKTKDSIIKLCILFFPCAKVLYLAHCYIRDGKITRKTASVLYLFVSLTFMLLFMVFTMKVLELYNIDKTTGFILIPCLIAGLGVFLFEIAKFFGVNLTPEETKGEVKEAKQEEPAINHIQAKPGGEKNFNSAVVPFKNYRNNVAESLPFNDKFS